ncbi:MAG: urease accessory protein UreD, partial [Pseudomonadota bacterium]|nr:urease accessory protein UreD [Pseudomonadota bacterium]
RVAADARIEWLPLESIAYSGCRADNRLRCELAEGAEMIGFDVVALGLPTAHQPFATGSYAQWIELPGRWIERGRIDASDTRALHSPLLWAGRSVLASAWFAAGTPLATPRREALLEAARTIVAAHTLASLAGATAPCAEAIVVRVLADRVEPATDLLRRVWESWRRLAWQLPPCPPRVWQT